MHTFQSKADRISQKNVAAMERSGELIPDEPDPPKTDPRICPYCCVSYINSPDRGYHGDEFFKVCPLCGRNPY